LHVGGDGEGVFLQVSKLGNTEVVPFVTGGYVPV
jgi:hypothetical protein